MTAGLIIKTTGFEDYLDRSGGAYVKCLVLGQPDVGKTRSASFWPKPIFADCEKGRMSLADRGVPYAEINSSADMDALLRMVKQDSQKPMESRKYLTFVLDTLDSYQRKIIAERLAKERKESLSGWADWGYLDSKMNNLIESLLNLPMNIVVNLHTKDDTEGDDESRLLVKKPKLKGDIREQIAAEFDLVGLMETGYVAEQGKRIKKRWIRWHSEPKYPILKDRSGQLPQTTPIVFSDDDYTVLFNHIVGDHVDAFPASTVVDELEVERDADPAPPDVAGGPVDVPKGALRGKPAKKTTKKATTKKAAAKKAGQEAGQAVADKQKENAGATSAPAQDKAADRAENQEQTSTDVPDPDVDKGQDEPTEDQAVKTVQDELGGTEVDAESDNQPADESPKSTSEEAVCGSQPPHFAGKVDPAPGCGRSLADVPRDRVNIALLRTKTRLCPDCFEQWKQAN